MNERLSRRQFLAASAMLLAAPRLVRAATAKPWNVAHRGGAQSPENTLAAFSKAIELGADAIELDVHLTADGDLAVIHDENLWRTSHQPGDVHKMSMADLKRTDHTIPRLREALRLIRGKCRVFVEIKQPNRGPHYQGIEKVVVDQITEEKMLSDVVIISFDGPTLKAVRELNADVPTGLLSGELPDLAQALKDYGVTWVAPQFAGITPNYVARAHARGIKVDAWTVDTELDLRTMIQAGCDAITTNQPELLKSLLSH